MVVEDMGEVEKVRKDGVKRNRGSIIKRYEIHQEGDLRRGELEYSYCGKW